MPIANEEVDITVFTDFAIGVRQALDGGMKKRQDIWTIADFTTDNNYKWASVPSDFTKNTALVYG